MYKVKRFSKVGNRMEFTHATATRNVKSILDKGLLGIKSHSKNSITNMSRNMTGSEKNLVYLSNDGRSSYLIYKVCEDHLGGGTILHISIPLSDFKKMKVVDNPEFLGSSSYEDFIKRYREKYKSTIDKSKIPDRNYYDMMVNGTTVIEGDIPAKYIRESPRYIGD